MRAFNNYVRGQDEGEGGQKMSVHVVVECPLKNHY